METPEIPYIQNDTAWYFFSVFYARENWAQLVSQVEQFYNLHRDKLSQCLISFSEEKGEQVKVSFATSIHQAYMKDEIEAFFQAFLKTAPSAGKTKFPYGKAIWLNYPDNTFIWYRLGAIEYSDLHRETFSLSMQLLGKDTSADSVFSVVLYLITKVLTCVAPERQKTILSDTLHEMSTIFGAYSFMKSIKKLIDEQMDIPEICETIEYYWTENESNCSPELKQWLSKVPVLLDKYYSYKSFCSFIGKLMGLKTLHQVMLLELMNIWYNNKQDNT